MRSSKQQLQQQGTGNRDHRARLATVAVEEANAQWRGFRADGGGDVSNNYAPGGENNADMYGDDTRDDAAYFGIAYGDDDLAQPRPRASPFAAASSIDMESLKLSEDLRDLSQKSQERDEALLLGMRLSNSGFHFSHGNYAAAAAAAATGVADSLSTAGDSDTAAYEDYTSYIHSYTSRGKDTEAASSAAGASSTATATQNPSRAHSAPMARMVRPNRIGADMHAHLRRQQHQSQLRLRVFLPSLD